MKKAKYYLGTDIGTSSCKAVIISSNGDTLAQSSKEYWAKSDKKGGAEIVPDEWFEAFKLTLKDSSEKASISPEDISGIGITGQMVTLVCVDGKGNCLRPAILWYDSRGFEYIDRLSSDSKDLIRRITYNPINATFTLPKLVWLKEKEPEIYKRIYKILWASDYIRMKLTGTYFTDMTNASSSLMYDMDCRDWSDDITGIFNISKKILPDILPAKNVIGRINSDASAVTGLKQGTPVIVGTGDIGADNVAAGVLKNNQCSIRFSTCATISVCLDRPIVDQNDRCPCSAHSIENLFLLQGTSASFGSSIRWIRDSLYSRVESSDYYNIMEKEISEVMQDESNLFFHSFTKAAPYWNEKMKGQFIGIEPHHTRGHFTRALYEGISFDLKEAILNLLKIKGINIPKEIFAIGGATSSRSLCNIVSNVLGYNLIKMKEADAAFGVAVLAWIGINDIHDSEKVLRRFIKYSGIINYKDNLKELYGKKYIIFKKIHNNLKEILDYWES
jgi:xylulokinase